MRLLKVERMGEVVQGVRLRGDKTKQLEPEHFREYRLRVVTQRLEAMPELADRLYRRLTA